jgi:hypothetical protein
VSLANCYFAHDSSGFPVLLPFFDAQSGRSLYPLVRHLGPVAWTWRRPLPGRGVASPEAPTPDRESLPPSIAESKRLGPHPCRLADPLGASNSSSPFRNCTEALDTARASQSVEQAKVPDAILTESPTEARPQRTERRTHSCGRRNEVTESQLGLSANRPTDRLGVQPPNRQRRGSQDSRPSLPAGTELWWPFLADIPGPHERQPLEYRSVQMRVGHVADPLGPGGHGSIHAPDPWLRRPCGKGRWCRTLSDVQPCHSRATLDAEVPELRQRSTLSFPPMASQFANTGGDRNQVHPLRSAVPSVRGKANRDPSTRVFGSPVVLDNGRPRKQAARFQDLLQQPSHAYIPGRANAGDSCVTTNRKSSLVSMATSLSGPLPDTGGCLILAKTRARCDIRSTSANLPRKHSVFLHRSVLRGSDRFTATGCVPKVKLSSLSQCDYR